MQPCEARAEKTSPFFLSRLLPPQTFRWIEGCAAHDASISPVFATRSEHPHEPSSFSLPHSFVHSPSSPAATKGFALRFRRKRLQALFQRRPLLPGGVPVHTRALIAVCLCAWHHHQQQQQRRSNSAERGPPARQHHGLPVFSLAAASALGARFLWLIGTRQSDRRCVSSCP